MNIAPFTDWLDASVFESPALLLLLLLDTVVEGFGLILLLDLLLFLGIFKTARTGNKFDFLLGCAILKHDRICSSFGVGEVLG